MSFILNVVLGLVMIITLMFTWGDMTKIASTDTGYPFLQIFYDTTHSLGGTNGMTCLLIIPLTASCMAVVATASRQIWAFSRDNGVPFSPLIAKVSDFHVHFVVMADNNLLGLGASHVKCSSQRRAHLPHMHELASAHQHRIFRGLECYPISQLCQLAWLIHALHHLSRH